ncbi:MAG TPA: 50S ribosomal protein L6 [bacterium]|nr:50S ribosomal protein L6 [bacterium]
MSRVGKLPIPIPDKVSVNINGQEIAVKGPLGQLAYHAPDGVQVVQDEKQLLVTIGNNDRKTHGLHGLVRTLVSNMVVGVSTGFKRELDIVGVGYRAEVKGNALVLSVGYSHPVEMELPKGVDAAVEKNTRIILTGSNKHVLGQFAANVRRVRPPEPYKGKGIKYVEEVVRRKVGKATG